MSVSHYHLFMDESGVFEGDSRDAARKEPFILAVLIADNLLQECEKILLLIAEKYGLPAFIHATEQARNPDFAEYLSELVGLVTDKKIFTVQFIYGEDLRDNLPLEQRDAFAANRYLSMAQSVIEYILFLHPAFMGKDVTFSLHPNSRTIPIAKSDTDTLSRLKSLGFHLYPINENNHQLLFHWQEDILRTYVDRLTFEYAPFLSRTGSRRIAAIDVPVAHHCGDPASDKYPGRNCVFINLVDNLAWWLRRQNIPAGGHNAPGSTGIPAIQAIYGREHQTYRSLAQTWLAGDDVRFIEEAMEQIPLLGLKGYRMALNQLLDTAIGSFPSLDKTQLRKLERLADSMLRQPSGQWSFLARLVGHLAATAESMTGAQPLAVDDRHLLARLYSHQVSIHNHRGEYADSREAYRKLEETGWLPASVDTFREWAAVVNRMGVTAANIFAFEESNRLLIPLEQTLRRSLQPLSQAAGWDLTDQLLARIQGTAGQNCAFAAPRRPDLFPKAEEYFIAAREQFEHLPDQLRHEVNLLHLYLDWEQIDPAKHQEADATARRITDSPLVAAFFQNPGCSCAGFTQFALAAVLKYHRARKKDFLPLLERYPLSSLKHWYSDAAGEHPFEFICADLGLAALQTGATSRGEAYLKHALGIPATNRPDRQPTLQVIRCQITVRWAMAEQQMASALGAATVTKMLHVVKVLRSIGQTKGLETMLCLCDGELPTGWFADGFEALSGVDWSRQFSVEACQRFLRCFTFNYR